MPIMQPFRPAQEFRFRRSLAEMSIKSDLLCSAVILVGLTSVLPRLTYGGPEGSFPLQVLAIAGIYLDHLLPPLVLAWKGRQHYVRWRELYLPAGMVLDGVALMVMRCWALMSEIQPGETAKILFMVYNMCTGHLVLLSLGRTLPFRHHAVAHSVLLAVVLRSLWRHCFQLRCKFQQDFHAWTQLLSRLAHLALPAAPLHLLAAQPAADDGSGEPIASCMADCMTVHGSCAVGVGFLLPLFIVYEREKLLRRRFLVARRGRPHVPPHPVVRLLLVGNQIVLFSLALSALVWGVLLLAGGGMTWLEGRAFDEADTCPGALH